MKTMIVCLLTSLLSFASFADMQTAEDLFKARGVKTENAYKAYELYFQMAQGEANKDLQAEKYWLASQAVYYVGSKATDNSDQKKFHQQGFEVAAKGVALLEKVASLNDVQKETLANAYYFYGANLGKWGEANGIASSLGRWPELQETMKKIIALKMNHIQDYGAFRILGRAMYKLPFPLGSNKKSLKFLETAFNETKNGQDISHNGLNVVFYANVLIAEDDNATAKAILSSLVNKNAQTYNPDRVPETLVEQEEAKELLKKL
jgi:hypothetical protein